MPSIENNPRYWLATFGKEHANRCPVDGGRFLHIDGRLKILDVSRGDIVVLTCALNYPSFNGMVAGIGIVTNMSSIPDCIYYNYVPARIYLHMRRVNTLLTPNEVKKRRYGHLIPNWIFPIAEISYRNISKEAGLQNLP